MLNRCAFTVVALLTLVAGPLAAQASGPRLEARPGALEMVVGESMPLGVELLGATVDADDVALRFAAPRRSLQVRDGTVRALQPGDWEIIVTAALPESSLASNRCESRARMWRGSSRWGSGVDPTRSSG